MDKIMNSIIENDFEWFKDLMVEDAINKADKNGFTPLMFCVQHGRTDMIDYLLKKNVDVNKVNNIGNSALFYAVFYSKNKTEIIEKLLKSGADMNIKNKSGISALSLANSMANENVSNFLNNYKCQ